MKTEVRRLISAETEVMHRIIAARDAVMESEDRLGQALTAGGDTSACRRVLYESKRLLAAAQQTLAGLQHRQQEIADESVQSAARMTLAGAITSIRNHLERFPLPPSTGAQS